MKYFLKLYRVLFDVLAYCLMSYTVPVSFDVMKYFVMSWCTIWYNEILSDVMVYVLMFWRTF